MIRIQLNGVTKKFRIDQGKAGASLFHWFWRQSTKKLTSLDTINLSCQAGEIVGVIGQNGSGKTTLLKIMAGIYQPESGTVIRQGKVVPLLESNAGAARKLTIKENIYLRCFFYGLTTKQIKASYQQIISDSGVAIDPANQLRSLSQGLAVRIAFATALNSQPDILLIDETFAASDQKFKLTIVDQVKKLAAKGSTVIIASHELDLIKNYCTRVVILKNGRIIFDGNPAEALSYYTNHL